MEARSSRVADGDTVVLIRASATMTRREFVLEYLHQVGTAYVKEMCEAWNDYRRQIGKTQSTYGAFRVLINSMKKDNEIVLDHTEPTQFNGYPRYYYRIRRG
jgi:hypothetical protein